MLRGRAAERGAICAREIENLPDKLASFDLKNEQ